MRVQIAPADKGGCRHYRCHLPSVQLKSEGLDCFMDDQIKAIRERSNPNNIIDAVPADPEVDVVVLQRPIKRDVVATIERLQARGIAVVVEIDDDLESVPRGNAAWGKVQPHLNPDSNKTFTKIAARMADLVTVSTPALAERYASHGRYAVIPNYIDEAWLDINEEKPDEFTVGWTGASRMHPGDVEALGTTLRQVLDAQDARFYCIGDAECFKALGVDGDVADFEYWADLDIYPHSISRNFHAGVVPLELNTFNESKSWLKGLEYAALGIPFVATPTADYKRLSEILEFKLAKKPKDWIKGLTRLINDEEAFLWERDHNRQVVREKLTIQKNAYKYAEAWERALKFRRKKNPVKKGFSVEALHAAQDEFKQRLAQRMGV